MISETVKKTEYFVKIYVDTIEECGVLSACAYYNSVKSEIKSYCDHYFVEAGPFDCESDVERFKSTAEKTLNEVSY